MGGAYSTHGSGEKFVQKRIHWTWRKETLQRYRRRWEDNIKMDLQNMRYEGLDFIHLTQSRDQWRAVVNTVMNLRVP